VHARIRLSGRVVARRQAASTCHRSQLGPTGTTRRAGWMLSRYVGGTDLFTLAQPRPRIGLSEVDLFEGVTPVKDVS
jgi:hypothetical protein